MITRILDWFEDFVRQGDMDDPRDAARLELKRQHCLLVMAEAREQARELGLSPRLTDLATVAGLVHDTGRFPQYRRWKTFRDAKSANHAILGTIALRLGGGLDGLDARERRLVRMAIVAHNRRALPAALLRGGDAEALALARIVRDADKIDIVRIMLEHFKTPGEKDDVVVLGLPDAPERYNPAIVADIRAGRIGDYGAMETVNDFVLLLLSWINDMYHARSVRLFFRRGHVRELFEQLPDTPAMREFAAWYHDRYAPGAS